MRKSLNIPSNLRFATADDFRKEGQLIVDIEYFEYIFYSFTWERRWTSSETDIDWLKTKIHLKYTAVTSPPTVYNVNIKAFNEFVTNLKTIEV